MVLNHRSGLVARGVEVIRRVGLARRVELAAVGGLLAILVATAIAPDAGAASAREARTLNVTDTAHAHYVKEVGSMLLDEGTAKGGLPGHVSARFDVGATAVSANFTIRARGGTISGHGAGKLHGVGATVSFGGTMTITHGTGRYAHARGHGGFYGTLNRRTYATVIQTTGTLSY
jgi:hypothetical protein